jgi:signal transduction histidine kinase
LAIVKDIIDKHEGEIWAEINPEGGSTFVLSLPTGL